MDPDTDLDSAMDDAFAPADRRRSRRRWALIAVVAVAVGYAAVKLLSPAAPEPAAAAPRPESGWAALTEPTRPPTVIGEPWHGLVPVAGLDIQGLFCVGYTGMDAAGRPVNDSSYSMGCGGSADGLTIPYADMNPRQTFNTDPVFISGFAPPRTATVELVLTTGATLTVPVVTVPTELSDVRMYGVWYGDGVPFTQHKDLVMSATARNANGKVLARVTTDACARDCLPAQR